MRTVSGYRPESQSGFGCFLQPRFFLRRILPAQNFISLRETPEFFDDGETPQRRAISDGIFILHRFEKLEIALLVRENLAALIRDIKIKSFFMSQDLVKSFADGLLG